MYDNSAALQEISVPRSEASPAMAHSVVRCAVAKSQSASKVIVDFALALLLLILSLPVMLVAAIAVKLTSRGPAFYLQTRLGRGEQPFTIIKIRTMTDKCEQLSGARWSTVGDSRITTVGRFLRRTHIDELPQLWNVIRGDMSLVGPRPERPEFVPKLADQIAGYRERMLVRPGVTGLAQVQLPPDSDLDSVRRKLAFDLFYIQNASVLLDLRLIAATALHAVGVPFRVTGTLFIVPTGKEIEDAYESALTPAAVTPEVQPV